MIALLAGTPGPLELLIMLIMAAVIVFPFWKIFSKPGFSGALSLLMLIPLMNVIMIFFLAFAAWPVLKTSQE